MSAGTFCWADVSMTNLIRFMDATALDLHKPAPRSVADTIMAEVVASSYDGSVTCLRRRSMTE